MTRKWNWRLWSGFAAAVAALLSYGYLARFPVTRDFPWLNLLLFGLSAALLITGLMRAFGRPQIYRGRIFGPVLALISAAMFVLFYYGIFVVARDLPASASAPRVGEKAPDFLLPDQNGKQTALTELLSPKGAVLIFYRGHWWLLCNSELRSFQEHLAEFDKRGVRIVAISVDAPDVSRRLCTQMKYTFTVLSDTDHTVVARYDLLHRGGGPHRTDISRPAEFLVDNTGTIRWRNLTENAAVRVRPEQVLAVFDSVQK